MWEFRLNFNEILLSVLDLFLFGIVFERWVRLVIAFGEFLYFGVLVDFVAFSKRTHALYSGQEFLTFMIIVSLGKYIDELFGEITHNL